MTDYKYDATFSFGIIEGDISFEINMLDEKIVPIVYMADNENEAGTLQRMLRLAFFCLVERPQMADRTNPAGNFQQTAGRHD